MNINHNLIGYIRRVMSCRLGLPAGTRGHMDRALDAIARGECGPNEAKGILREIAEDLGISLPEGDETL